MSERISLIATTDGPLQFYAAPGLSSHGDARAGWGIRGGAELEWTGEQHDSLVVRYEDKSMAATIKQMVIDRYPTRKALIATIFETRGQSGKVMWYPRTLDELASVQTKEAVPSVGFANLQVLCDIQHVNDIDLLGYAHPLAQLQSIGGGADLRGYAHPLAQLQSIGGTAYLRGYAHPLAQLQSIGGTAYLEGYAHPLAQLQSIDGGADLEGYAHPLAQLQSIGGTAYLEGYAHPLAQLQSIGGAAYLRGYKHPLKASIAGRVYR